MSLSIQKIKFNTTEAISTSGQAVETKHTGSIFGAEKNEKTETPEDAKKTKEIQNKSNQVINKLSNTKKLGDAKRNVQQLIEKNEHIGIFQIASNLKDKLDGYSEKQLELLAKAMDISRGDVSEADVSKLIDDIANEAETLASQINTLNNNVIQTKNLNQAVIKFKANGGDPDKINWDKINEKMTENLDAIGKDGEQRATEADSGDNTSAVSSTSSNTPAASFNGNIDTEENIKDFDKQMDELTKYLSSGGKEKPQNNEFLMDDREQAESQTAFASNPFGQENNQKKMKFGFLGLNNV